MRQRQNSCVLRSMTAMYHAFRIDVFVCVRHITASDRPSMKGIPSRPPAGRACPEDLKIIYTGLQKMLNQKRVDHPHWPGTAALGRTGWFPQPFSYSVCRPMHISSLRLKRTLPDCPARFHDTDQDFRSFIQLYSITKLNSNSISFYRNFVLF